MRIETAIPVLSLLVAGLAVFVGPVLSARSAKRAMLGPMRQKWINDLRQLLSEITSSCLHYYQTGYEDRTEEEYKRITQLEHQIIFMLNPNEAKHENLISITQQMVRALEKGKEGEEQFIGGYEKLLVEGKKVLKEEWNVVKNA